MDEDEMTLKVVTAALVLPALIQRSGPEIQPEVAAEKAWSYAEALAKRAEKAAQAEGEE